MNTLHRKQERFWGSSSERFNDEETVGKAARSTIPQLDLSARAGGGANIEKRDALEQTSAILTQARPFFSTSCSPTTACSQIETTRDTV